MAIQQQEYIDLKEYWDFQRKKEYNKERIFAMADKFEGRAFTEFGPVNIEEMKQMLWTKIPQSEYEDPKWWVQKTKNIDYGMKNGHLNLN